MNIMRMRSEDGFQVVIKGNILFSGEKLREMSAQLKQITRSSPLETELVFADSQVFLVHKVRVGQQIKLEKAEENVSEYFL